MVRHTGHARKCASHSVQMHRCRHGNTTTDATRFPHPLHFGPDATTRSGSIYADSASSAWPSPPAAHDSPPSSAKQPPPFSCAPPLMMACCSCACREAAVASCAFAFACQTCASTLSCAARASNSAFLRTAFSTSASFSLNSRATVSSAAVSSAR